MRTSLLTITRNRDIHLRNLLRGVEQSDLQPDEIIVCFMNQAEHPHLPAHVRVLDVASDRLLPLAQARNTAAQAAHGEILIFLDVDCIPDSQAIGTLVKDAQRYNGLVMGDPWYTSKTFNKEYWTPASVAHESAPHPARAKLKPGLQSDYTVFWSLIFAMPAQLFRQIKFDESFTGYGAEDTDFALTAKAQGIPFALSQARAFHQYHPTNTPPLNHFEDIVANAHVFYQKWGVWPMEHWLGAFKKLGLIEWDEAILSILRTPTAAELKATVSSLPYA